MPRRLSLCWVCTAAVAAARPRPLALHRGGSAAAALTNASALNATGEALDLNDAHDNATANATTTNNTDGLRASIKAYFRGAKELWGDVKTWRRLRREAKNGTSMVLSWHLCENQNFTARCACSMAWRCRFLTARPSQDGRAIAEK